MTGPVVTACLIGGALLLTIVVPRLLARWTALRAVPGQALFLWQAVSLAGVSCALLATPVAALTFGTDRPRLLAAALIVSLLVLGRLLWSGHRVGSDLRRMRATHAQLVDLVGERLEDGDDVLAQSRPTNPVAGAGAHRHVRLPGDHKRRVMMISEGEATAYCLPGRRERVVLSRAALDSLDDHELDAVLAHEDAHLAQRHDLLLELFTVLHEAVPAAVRAPSALREVHLLAELLADRGALSHVDPPTLGRALVAMAGGHPGPSPVGSEHGQLRMTTARADTVLSAGHHVHARLRALAAPDAPTWLRTGLPVAAVGALALPWALVLLLVVV
ncbi:M56 family metallopeptidase [Ornithinimicrobium sp. Y1694]|uniref:M56 family metallopeptidase n=1 Tax=Ornithinimicrobium sp. Y1694 TaxID=3418590 RepID=UPI003CEFFEC2